MANPDDKGQTKLVADTDGEVSKVRIDGGYLAQALKACGGMVNFKLTSPSSPMLFSSTGYQLVVMPLLTAESQSQWLPSKYYRNPQPPPTKLPTLVISGT